MVNWRRRLLFISAGIVVLLVAVVGAWAVAIGPTSVWRVVTNGTTTVWDHLAYPGRDTTPSPLPQPWPTRIGPEPIVDGEPINTVLADHDALAFVVIHKGTVVYEWAREGHAVATPSMLFSSTKSITSLLIGAAIEDGLIGSAQDAVTEYIPELAAGGFGAVTVEDVLRMDTNSTYVESDNPFGVHVEFNYTDDLEADILDLEVGSVAHAQFTYKSGDNAILGLILDRVVGSSITEYLQTRVLDPLGVEHAGAWSTDRPDGLERTWCCLALSASDFARFGQLILDDGGGIIASEWIQASFEPGFSEAEWPSTYDDSRITNYGYQWWLVGDSAVVALGKDGQYLYIDLSRDVTIVRTGTSTGGIGWVDILHEVSSQYPSTG